MELSTTDELLAIRRKIFLEENQEKWLARGQAFKRVREDNELPLSNVASELGISPNRLKRFENGIPVQSAKLIEAAYTMFIDLHELRADIEALSLK